MAESSPSPFPFETVPGSPNGLLEVIKLASAAEMSGKIKFTGEHLPPVCVGDTLVKPIYTNEGVVLSGGECSLSYGHGGCYFCAISYTSPSSEHLISTNHIFGGLTYTGLDIARRLNSEGHRVDNLFFVSRDEHDRRDILKYAAQIATSQFVIALPPRNIYGDGPQTYRVWTQNSQGNLLWAVTSNSNKILTSNLYVPAR